ncbi:hypothetical protein CXP47_11695 [Pseudomonas chlororaphis]|nr:hypothetical protein CXP47_11695 [Pseudomonas chlororaphis]
MVGMILHKVTPAAWPADSRLGGAPAGDSGIDDEPCKVRPQRAAIIQNAAAPLAGPAWFEVQPKTACRRLPMAAPAINSVTMAPP